MSDEPLEQPDVPANGGRDLPPAGDGLDAQGGGAGNPLDGAGGDAALAGVANGAGGAGKLVPVTEAMKYRRRAQQAETRLQQAEQALADVQGQCEARLEQLATAEAQRDELQSQFETARRRWSAERLLAQAGVADVETALALLDKRADLSAEIEPERLAGAVEQLLADKPFLLAAPAALPGKTASARPAATGPARLARAATTAARTGNRRDVAEYLRLRRQAAR